MDMNKCVVCGKGTCDDVCQECQIRSMTYTTIRFYKGNRLGHPVVIEEFHTEPPLQIIYDRARILKADKVVRAVYRLESEEEITEKEND